MKKTLEILIINSIITTWCVFYLFTFTALNSCARANAAEAKYKIAIIDTGYDPSRATVPLKLCAKGHYDFEQNKPAIGVTKEHGTVVASIIAKALVDVDYCAVIYQVVKGNIISDVALNGALRAAAKEKFTAINFSIVGIQHLFAERNAVELVVKNQTKLFAAAGNENQNLDLTCISYPACYSIENVYIVGALSPDRTQKASYSNYGSSVKIWYPGSVQTKDGDWVQGTSFASPAALADYVLSLEVK